MTNTESPEGLFKKERELSCPHTSDLSCLLTPFSCPFCRVIPPQPLQQGQRGPDPSAAHEGSLRWPEFESCCSVLCLSPCGYFTAWSFPLFAELAVQNLLCRTKPRFVFSRRRCHLPARTSLCSHLQSRQSALCSCCRERGFTLCHSCQHMRSKQSVSEGRRNTQQSNPRCLPGPFHLTFSGASLNRWGRNLHSPLPSALILVTLTAKSRLETDVKAL